MAKQYFKSLRINTYEAKGWVEINLDSYTESIEHFDSDKLISSESEEQEQLISEEQEQLISEEQEQLISEEQEQLISEEQEQSVTTNGFRFIDLEEVPVQTTSEPSIADKSFKNLDI